MTAEHDQGILVNHVQPHEPYSPVDDGMQHYPGVPLNVQLLNGGPVSPGLIPDGVDVPVPKSAAVRSSYSLLKTRQSLLLHGADLEILTLFQVLALQGAANDVHKVLELRDSKVDSVVHHFSQGLECFRGDIEKQDLGTWNISGPIELVGFVPSNNQNIALVNDYYLSLTNLFVKDFETRPFQSFKVIKCMLVELGKIE